MPPKKRLMVAGTAFAGLIALAGSGAAWHYLYNTNSRCARLPAGLEKAAQAKIEADAAARLALTDKSEQAQEAARKAMQRAQEAADNYKKSAEGAKPLASGQLSACRG